MNSKGLSAIVSAFRLLLKRNRLMKALQGLKRQKERDTEKCRNSAEVVNGYS